MSIDGRIFLHSDMAALSGRRLEDSLYRSIAQAVGLSRAGTIGNPEGGSLPGGGYAAGYRSAIDNSPLVLIAGLDIQETHLAQETVDPGSPTVRADQVVDRATLKAFVNEATEYLVNLYRTEGRSAFTKAKSVFRDPGGPWRHGPVYLFIIEPSGYTIFHGAFPDKFEFQVPTTTLRDVVTGELILPQIIRTAQAPGGGFVKYYFDNPDDATDRADVPKVTYARQHVFERTRPDGSPVAYPLIFGAGIYGDPDTESEESMASAQGWLARFGRAVAGDAVEMISGRMNSPAPAGAKMVLGGQAVKSEDDAVLSRGQDGFALMGGTGPAPWGGENRVAFTAGSPTGAHNMSLPDFLGRSSFQLSAAKGADDPHGRRWTAWGRGALTKFEGAAATEGDVTTGMLGVDYGKDGWLGGVALSHARGKGGFDNQGRSEMEATLTSVLPYVRFALNERISAWGILGIGWGEMTLDEQVIEKVVKTDIDMRMGAVGFRGALLSASKTRGFDLALKSDLLMTQVDADAKDGLESITGGTTRIRVMLEAAREIAMEGRGSVRPALEVGLRHDGGDVDEGMGVEVGGSVRFTAAGVTMQVSARTLLTHAEEDVKDWGVGGLIRFDPDQAGRGLAITVEPAMGSTAGGAARLWSLRDVSRLGDEGIDIEPRVRAEVGYGMDAMGGILTPYAGLSVSATGRETYRVGGRFNVGKGLSMSFEGDRREHARDAEASHGVALQGSLHW